jgi:hypothetical protein
VRSKSGTAVCSGGAITVTGLGFTPKAVLVRGTYAPGTTFFSEQVAHDGIGGGWLDGLKVSQYRDAMNDSYGTPAVTQITGITVTSDGFTCAGLAFNGTSYEWYAMQ